MNDHADNSFLPETHRARVLKMAAFRINAGRLYEEKTDFVCAGVQVKETSNHINLVTAVTDGHNFTLLTCGYSASSFFEFATSSSSGEIQVDSCPSLNRANFPARSPNKRIEICRKRQPAMGPHRGKSDKFLRSIQYNKHHVLVHSSTI